jgi:hypothetical protein
MQAQLGATDEFTKSISVEHLECSSVKTQKKKIDSSNTDENHAQKLKYYLNVVQLEVTTC